MANPVEIVVRAVDRASSVFDGIRNTGVDAGERIANSMDDTGHSVEGVGDSAEATDGVMKNVFDNWESYAKKAGLAISGLGLAVDGLAKKNAGMTEQVQKVANVTGMTTGEVRELALEITDITSPVDYLTEAFLLATQQGIRSGEEMQNYASYWSTVGDATGESAIELAKAGVALRGIGIDAGNESEAINAFGFILQDTTSSVGEFLTFIERSGPHLREMGMDVDDAAAVLGILEHELGMSGRMARQEFRKAVNEAEGSLEAMFETLGVTEESFNSYREQVKNSSDVIQENADINAETHTALDKMKYKLEELAFTYGDQIQMLGDLSGIMVAMGPAIQVVAHHQQIATAATKAWTVAQNIGAAAARAFGVAQTMALGPIGLIIAAIAAVIAIVVLMVKHWDKVKEVAVKVWEAIVQAAQKAWELLKKGAELAFKAVTMHWRLMYMGIKAGIDWVMQIGPKIWEGIKKGGELAFKFITSYWRAMYNGVKAGIDWVMQIGPKAWEGLKNAGKTAFEFIKNIWSGLKGFFKGLWDGIVTGFKAPFNFLINAVNSLINAVNKINIKVPDWVPAIGGRNFGFNLPNIPRLHTGGIYRAPVGQTEGIALLKDGERVIDPMTTRKQIQNEGKSRPLIVRVELDGRTLAEVVGDTIMNEVILRGGW